MSEIGVPLRGVACRRHVITTQRRHRPSSWHPLRWRRRRRRSLLRIVRRRRRRIVLSSFRGKWPPRGGETAASSTSIASAVVAHVAASSQAPSGVPAAAWRRAARSPRKALLSRGMSGAVCTSIICLVFSTLSGFRALTFKESA